MSRSFLVALLAGSVSFALLGCSDSVGSGSSGVHSGDGGVHDDAKVEGDDGGSHDDGGDESVTCSAPNKNESGSCGNCGVRTRTCRLDLTWSAWTDCSGEGECAPSAKDSESCGTSGTMTRTCSSSCSWGSFGECVGDAPSCGTLGAVDSAACGNCGTKTRTCGSSGWSEWSSCGGEGACAAGATDSASCGTGGTKTRTCSSSCTWGTYGTCVGGTPATGCVGTVKQTFSSSGTSGMWGCSGSVTWSTASTLCASGMHVCSASEFTARRSFTTPSHHYWTSDYLAGSGTEGACKASLSTSSDFCPSDAPMRVCGTTKTDSSGNYCTWVGCGYESTSSSLYFGGCNDDGFGKGVLAGALCCN